MSPHVELMVPPRRRLRGPEAPRQARQMVRQLLADQPAEVVEVAVLLTSELVANAVTHTSGGSLVQLSATTSKGVLRVCVGDEDRALPVLKHPTPEGDSGRGIEIVDHLATAWGVECRASEDGKSVWFELRLPTPNSGSSVGRIGPGAKRRAGKRTRAGFGRAEGDQHGERKIG